MDFLLQEDNTKILQEASVGSDYAILLEKLPIQLVNYQFTRVSDDNPGIMSVTETRSR